MADDDARLDSLQAADAAPLKLPRREDELALDTAGPLLRFVAESGKLADPSVTAAIIAAQEARSRGSAWDSKLASDFWGAYSQLCCLAAPVTVDAIMVAAKADRPNPWRWFTGSRRKVTLSQLTADNYVALLLVTILVALTAQLYGWGLDTSSRQMAAAAAPFQTLATELSQRSTLLDAQTQGVDAVQGTDAARAEAGAIRGQAKRLEAAAAAVCSSALALRAWMGPTLVTTANAETACDAQLPSQAPAAPATAPAKTAPATAAPATTAPATTAAAPKSPPVWVRAAAATSAAAAAWAQTSAYVGTVQARAQIIAGILNGFVLPVLFGLAGAAVYVVRTISEQIKTTTFTSVSPLRHRIRVSLGPLMGLIIGLFVSVLQLPNGFSILALAFLAGYAVEAVMSLFDGLVANFTKAK